MIRRRHWSLSDVISQRRGIWDTCPKGRVEEISLGTYDRVQNTQRENTLENILVAELTGGERICNENAEEWWHGMEQ